VHSIVPATSAEAGGHVKENVNHNDIVYFAIIKVGFLEEV
jgi:hypothetical protein